MAERGFEVAEACAASPRIRSCGKTYEVEIFGLLDVLYSSRASGESK